MSFNHRFYLKYCTAEECSRTCTALFPLCCPKDLQVPSVLHGEGAELHRSGVGLPIYWEKQLPRAGMISSAAVFTQGGKEIEHLPLL